MAYPAGRFDVHVVADHCSDDTAAVAEAAGATVHVRGDEPRGRKGYAVDWLIRRLLADPRRYDAIAIFDADSQVDAGFLSAVAHRMADGARVVQGRHVIGNPGVSLFAALADADMRLNNRIRNQAKENLGLSARLMGDAMALRRDVLEQHPWLEAGSLTEVRAYGIYLVTQGVRIRFAADALSYGQAAARWRMRPPNACAGTAAPPTCSGATWGGCCRRLGEGAARTSWTSSWSWRCRPTRCWLSAPRACFCCS